MSGRVQSWGKFESKLKFCLGFIEIFQPKKRPKLAFSVGFFPQNRIRGKKHPL